METFKDIISSPVPVLVDFYADWCNPCKAMSSILLRVKEEEGTSVRIIKIDVDKNRDIALRYSIQTIPTLMIFKEGKQLWRQSGVMDTSELIKVVDMFK